MLNHVERFWAIFGYLLILLAFILDLGILVLLRFGLVGLLFWTWAFQCCWVLVLLVFILDLGISVSLSFGLVGLYFLDLGISVSLSFGLFKSFSKKM